MEFFKNIHTHTKGKLKGRIDDEYYAIREKQVLCIYIAQIESEIEVSLSYWNSSWKFGNEISEEEYEKPFMKSVFTGQVNKKMVNFYFGDK